MFRLFRLGLFVVSGTLLLIASLYLIGRNQHWFGSSIRLVSYFTNVNGLQPGNNVRFAGSDAGNIESVEVTSDTAVRVVIILDAAYHKFIRKDAIASIGTDGLMGNKLINIINTPHSKAQNVVNGDTILTLRPVETDEMLRTLNQTNEYVARIAFNLKNVTDRVTNSRGTMWKLLTDTSLAEDMSNIFTNLNQSSSRISHFSKELDELAGSINNGKGLIGTLVKDTALSAQFYHIAGSLNKAGEETANAAATLAKFTNDIDEGKGTLGMLLRDSSAANDLRTSISTLKQSAESLNQSMEAIKKIPVLKKYLEEGKKSKR